MCGNLHTIQSFNSYDFSLCEVYWTKETVLLSRNRQTCGGQQPWSMYLFSGDSMHLTEIMLCSPYNVDQCIFVLLRSAFSASQDVNNLPNWRRFEAWWNHLKSSRTLHEKEKTKGFTRMQFFIIAMVCSFAWYILPGYMFGTLTSLSWVCWIWKDSIFAHQIGSGTHRHYSSFLSSNQILYSTLHWEWRCSSQHDWRMMISAQL